MAKSAALMIASALCLLSLAGLGHCQSTRLFVEGKVYCDTCRSQFVTKISEYMKGATVRLECKESEAGALTYSHEAVTDETGTYRIPVDGEHEDELCSVQLVKSSVPECAEISDEPFSKLSAKVSLTANNGMASPVRQANPLGFLKKDPLPNCTEVLRELGITPDGLA